MSVSKRHLLRQGAVVRSLGRTVWKSVMAGEPPADGPAVETPGPELVELLPPRDPRLIRDYIKAVGGDPKAYRGTVPPHMFPQWGFPLLSRALEVLPYNMTRLLNGGCRMEMLRALPADESLELRARLVDVDDDGTRALIRTQLITGTASAPDALISHITAFLPLAKKKGSDKKERPRVPAEARQLDSWKLRAGCGADFAALTGDINPIHWSPRYARMAGFKKTILHGFSMQARVAESLNRQLFSGDPTQLAELEVRFVKPLLVPGKTSVWVTDDGDVAVGDAPGGPAALTGKYTKIGSES